MLKWLLTLGLAVVVLGVLTPLLARWLPPGGLPGDVAVRFRGRLFVFPIASTLLFSVVLWLVSRFL